MSPADEKPFLDAILAHYHDDGPRLVYADFLDETGEPADAARAEFIRVQVALAKLPEDHPRRPALVERQSELKQAHWPAWTAHLAGLGDHTQAEFRRGIPDAVSVEAEVFLARGDELFRRGPIRRVQLRDAARLLPKLIHCPFLAEVRELDLCGRDLGNGGVNLLVRSPYLTRVQVLDLGFNGLDDAGVRVLAKASTLPQLHELSLGGNEQITAEGVRFLAESPFFAGLSALDLSGNDVNDAGVRAVSEGRATARLRSLKLANNHIGDAGVAALLGSALLGRMLDRSARLDLRANNVGPVGAELLAGWPGLARVSHLDLRSNWLRDEGLAALLGSPHLGGVRVLKLGQNQITDHGALAIREVSERLFGQLRLLDLSGNRLTRFGLGVLQTAKGMHPLTLDLSENVQPATGGEVPVPVADVLAELRRRVWNPARRDPR
jgi:uncharacterized protein (TIGR02996 family)